MDHINVTDHLPAKLVTPAVNGALPRQRLFDRLSSAMQHHRLTWLHAPAGAGKSTTAAGFTKQCNMPTLWYRLDEGDGDPACFFQNFLVAAKACFGEQPGTVRFSPEFLSNPNGYARQLFRSVLPNDGIDRLIVFDDFHSVEEYQYFQSVIPLLCNESSESYKILILSRTFPPSYCLAALYSVLTVVSANELNFTPEETLSLAKSKSLAIDDDGLALCMEETGGWAAALSIVFRRKKTNASNEQRFLQGLAQEAWKDMPEHARHHLQQIALPLTVSEAVAEELTEDPEVRQTLSALAEDYYLVSRVDADEAVYKIHPLLRDYLLDMFRKRDDVERKRARLIRTAEVLERHQQFGEAAEFYIEAQSWPALVLLIHRHAKTELLAGRSVRLLHWFNALPETAFEDPWLNYWHGAALLHLDPQAGQSRFEKAHAAFGEDQLGRLLSSAGVINCLFFAWDDYSNASVWFDELATLEDFRVALDDRNINAWVMGCGNVLVNLNCHRDLLKTWVEHGDRMMFDNPPDNRLLLASFLLQYRIWHGDIAGCRLLAMRLNEVQTEILPLFQATLHIWTAVSAILSVDHEAAFDVVAKARQCAEQYGLVILLPQIEGLEAYAALSALDLDRAGLALDRMEASLLPGRRFDKAFFLHARSCWLLLANDLIAAKKDAETVLSLTQAIGSVANATLIQKVLAQILVFQGDLPSALSHLDEVDRHCLNSENLYILFLSRLTRAHGLLEMGNEALAASVLEEVLTLGHQYQYKNTHPVWVPQVMSRLCAFALQKELLPDYVHSLINERELLPDGTANENWPWPIKIRTLGGFRVDTTLTTKKAGKPILLLQMLIATNPDGISREILADKLWPDADADAALHTFEVTLHRLRKMLGRADAILLTDSVVSINRTHCWIDFWILDQVARRLDDQTSNPAALANRVLQVWRGAFLADSDIPEFTLKRNALSDKFVQVMRRIGTQLEHAECLDLAEDCYRRAVEAEPLAESLHDRLIDLLHRRKKPMEALAAYRHYKTLHFAQFGADESKTLKKWGILYE